MFFFRLRDAVDKLLREEQGSFRPNFHSQNNNEELPKLSKPFVPPFIDFEQAFGSADRRALAKALSLYGLPDKYIKVNSAMCENNTAVVKVGNVVTSWLHIKLGVKQGSLLSLFIWVILIDFVLRAIAKAI